MKLLENILDIIAPYNCLACGREGNLLCAACSVDACPRVPERCYRCKKLTSDFAVCASCKKASNLQNVWVRTEYNDVAKQLIYKLKFQSARAAAKVIAEMMCDVLPVLPDDMIVVHVPTSTKRKRQRGFDQSEKIAKELARRTSVPYHDLLSRVGTTRQVGSGRQQRLEQLKDAFLVKNDVRGKCILLVDDIVTTGGTLESAARALKQARAKKVCAITFAQK